MEGADGKREVRRVKAAGEGGARPAGRATREEQVARRLGGGWQGEAETGEAMGGVRGG